jgi:hypothetical protein
VRRVLASYPVAELTNGFSVTGSSRDGLSWAVDMSRESAAEDLLLAPTTGSIPGVQGVD